MRLLDSGKGKIVLTFYDMVTGMIIKDPIQVEIRRGINQIGTKVVRDGKLIMNDVPRAQMELMGYITSYYKYRFKITSSRYMPKIIRCEFDRHTKEIDLDIALEPREVGHDTRIY